MPKIWTFGDSFSTQDMPPTDENPSGTPNHPSWLEYTSQGLGITEAIVHANYGVSNDWIFDQFKENIELMESGDYVIIQTTQKHRQWFFEDPCVSNYWLRDLEKHVSKDELDAVHKYIAHLQSDKVDDLRYIQFCLALERISQIAAHLRILVLPGFFGVNGVNGTLISICDDEFDNDVKPMMRSYDQNSGKDPRLNHMSGPNHEILGNKIVEFFKNGTVIDLTSDFKKNILN
jgi:hypothetical protein